MLSQVAHHSAICPPSMRNTAPKSNCAFRPDGEMGPLAPAACHAATRFRSATARFIRFAGGETIALFVRFSTQSTTTNNQGNPS